MDARRTRLLQVSSSDGLARSLDAKLQVILMKYGYWVNHQQSTAFSATRCCGLPGPLTAGWE
jgi:hypothetical protein